ncbi:MAG: TRAP transporter substrate-binding protein [Rubrobacter sp.]|nr:TRAP transporter substrate-binding protein [Rubrobacter sp.]
MEGSSVYRYVGRWLSLAVLLVASMSLVVACGGGSSSSSGGSETSGGGGGGAEYNFRLAEAHPEDHPTAQADQEFARLLDEKSDGRIQVEVFENAQLGEEASAIEQVQTGAIEMTRVSSAPMAEFVDEMGVFSLPYIFDDGEHMWNFLQGEGGQQLLTDLESSGFHGLTYYDPGARSFYTAGEPVESMGDLQGLDIRIQQNDINVAWMEALGGSPTPMDYGEVYSSLQSGVLDGAENNWPSYQSSGHYEVAPNFTESEHQRVPELLMISQQVWDQMSEEDRQIMQEAADESTEFQREEWQKASEQAEQEMKDEGVNVINNEDIEDLDEWKEAVQPVIEEYQGEYGEVLDQIDQARQ